MFFVIFALWIIFNGKITVQIGVVGLILSAALYAFCRKYLGYGGPKKKNFIKRLGYLMEYIVVLIVEIIKANLTVLKMTVSKELDFEPQLFYFRTDLKETSSRVMLANSITLTPGTITVTLEDDLYCIHCLDKSMAEGMEESSFVQILRKIEEAGV